MTVERKRTNTETFTIELSYHELKRLMAEQLAKASGVPVDEIMTASRGLSKSLTVEFHYRDETEGRGELRIGVGVSAKLTVDLDRHGAATRSMVFVDGTVPMVTNAGDGN